MNGGAAGNYPIWRECCEAASLNWMGSFELCGTIRSRADSSPARLSIRPGRQSLRFTKTGNRFLEEAYRTHYLLQRPPTVEREGKQGPQFFSHAQVERAKP